MCSILTSSEAIKESKKLKILLILITLDAEKAFDKRNHEILFNKLYHYGIKGKLWILLRNLYKGMSIKVKWEGQCSEDVMGLQGKQQGAILSTTLYKCYNNVILDSILKKWTWSIKGYARTGREKNPRTNSRASNNTANMAVYTPVGAEPIAITLDKNVLTLFMNIVRNSGTIECEILRRQIVFSDQRGKDFINRVEKLYQNTI
ncbi:unnamed protein product [Mytilus edulis]|uniref:Reverse transcriptase domain-containing protein n=1 Tax=Mytilus edulis TaxID=6550 RepID=A0A8S3UUQ0_MYTED|nr:unnamed protein product [Mytilus edulis]